MEKITNIDILELGSPEEKSSPMELNHTHFKANIVKRKCRLWRGTNNINDTSGA